MADRHHVGVDAGSRFVKVLQLTDRGTGRYVVTQFACAELRGPESLTGVVQSLMAGRPFRTRRCAFGVSGRSVFVRYVSMPVMGEEELVNAARYELGKYVPVEVEELLHDVSRLEEPAPGASEMKVLLAAARRAYVDAQTAAIENAGLTPNVVDVECFALANAFEVAGQLNPGGAEGGNVVAIVDVGASKSNVVIMNQGVCQFTREFYKGGDDITEVISKKLSVESRDAERLKRAPAEAQEKVGLAVENVLDDMGQEVKISIDFFENQYEREIGEVYLTGGSCGMIGLKEGFERMTQKPIRIWNPIDSVPLELSPDAEAELRAHAWQSAISIGLAARFA